MNNIINNTEGLLEEYYITSDQSDEACFYVPDVNPNEAPVFRGQCETISGVQGFNIQRVSLSLLIRSFEFLEKLSVILKSVNFFSNEEAANSNTYTNLYPYTLTTLT